VSSLASAHAMMDRKKHCAFGFTPLSCNQKFRVNQLQIDDASSEGHMGGARRAPCWQGFGLRRHAPSFDAHPDPSDLASAPVSCVFNFRISLLRRPATAAPTCFHATLL